VCIHRWDLAQLDVFVNVSRSTLARSHYQVKHRSGSQWATSIESDRAGVFDPTDGSEHVISHSVGNLSRYRSTYQT